MVGQLEVEGEVCRVFEVVVWLVVVELVNSFVTVTTVVTVSVVSFPPLLVVIVSVVVATLQATTVVTALYNVLVKVAKTGGSWYPLLVVIVVVAVGTLDVIVSEPDMQRGCDWVWVLVSQARVVVYVLNMLLVSVW